VDADLTGAFCDTVRAAIADGSALYLKGGGSKLTRFGRHCDATALDTAAHRGIVSYRPAEMILTARSGTPLAELEAAAGEAGQRLAFEAPVFSGTATIGGTLACNNSGPSRPWRGSVRDAVLGLRLIDGRGRSLRFGGEVIKNVAGYDVSRLQAGALGTLGLITEVSLRLLPKTDAQLQLLTACDAEAAIQRMRALSLQALPLTGACWHDGELQLRFEGSSAAVRALRTRFPDYREGDAGFWSRLREWELPELRGTHTRIDLAPATPAQRLEKTCLIDWAGALRLIPGVASLTELSQSLAGATAQLEIRGCGDQSGEVTPTPPAALQRMLRRIKQAADPHAVFNPGRLYAWM
jgi:glycolate oxidase FAD binding subunit